MRADQWAGLVTKASPYILPAGAAVEQVNLDLTIPGQLTTRGGMRRVVCTEQATDILDCFPCQQGGRTVMVALTASGSLVALPSPAYGDPTPMPSEPIFTLASGETGATYTQRFVLGPVTETAPSPPGASLYTNELDGGAATTSPYSYIVDSGATVSSAYAYDYVGGIASTPEFPPSLPRAALPTP